MNPMSLPQTQKRTMTMIKKIFSGLIFVAALTACTDDYKDWAPIPTTPQPETVAFGDGSVTEMSVIDLNAVTDENVQVCSIKAPTASDAAYTPYYTITIGDETYSIDASGTMSAAELQTIVANNFGRRPVQREIEATVSMWLSNGKTAVKTATSAPFKVRVIPQAPEVEQAYYVTGSINGWDNTNTSYKLTNDGRDPYENPTFTCRIPAPEDGSTIEFKMTPESGLGGDWSKCLAAGSEDGKFVYDNAGGNLVIPAAEGAVFYDLVFNMLDQTWTATPLFINIEKAYYFTGSINGWNNNDTSYKLTNDGRDPYENPTFTCRIPAPEDGSNVEFKMTPESGLGGDWSKCLAAGSSAGTFVYNNGGGNLVIESVEGAKFYDLTFNMMELTWSYKAVKFGNFFYEIGNESGWGTSHPLYDGSGEGTNYQGYYYLNGEFKFKPNADNWDDDLEYADGNTTSGNLVSTGGPNCPDPGAGFYQINLNVAAMTYSLNKIEAVGIIGDFNGWGGDVDMTFNVNDNCWEATATVSDGGLKFRANHDWAINWGGDTEGLTQDGANINVSAGTYKFQLFLSYQGNHRVVITKQ